MTRPPESRGGEEAGVGFLQAQVGLGGAGLGGGDVEAGVVAANGDDLVRNHRPFVALEGAVDGLLESQRPGKGRQAAHPEDRGKNAHTGAAFTTEPRGRTTVKPGGVTP